MNQEKCCEKCICRMDNPKDRMCHDEDCPCHTSPKEVKIGDKLEANTEYIADVPSPKEEIHPDYCQCKMCEPPKEEIVNDWEDGSLTFDKIKNILDVCNVKDVKIKQDYLTISFAPKNVIGNTWQLLKERMLQITKK